MTDAATEPLRGWRFLLFVAALALANVVMLSNVPGYTILVPYAAGNLMGVNPSFGTWGTTDHMIGIALGLPFARWFAARWGERRVYAAALVAYALFAAVCASAESMWSFLPGRIALGFAGGIAMPLGQALTLGEYAPEHRTVGVGFWGLLSMMPFTVGVFMGGFWAEYFGWRWLFLSDIVVALCVAGVVAALLHGRPHRRRITRFDTVGFVLLAAILFGAQTIFNMGNDFDWLSSPILMTAFVVVAAALPAFVVWELGERHPVLDLRLFRHRNYAVAVTCSVVGFLFIQGLLSLLIGQLQTLVGNTSSLAGLVYMMMIFCAAPLAAIVHELNRNIDLRLVACLNFLGFAVTLSWLGLYDKLASFDEIRTPMVFFGFSLAMFFAPLGALAAHGLSGARLTRAAEELALLRTAAGAFGIALMGVVQFRRAPFHQLSLSEHFGGARSVSLDLFGQLSGQLQALGFSAAAAQSQMARILRQQALVLALDDAFFMGALTFVFLAFFVWLAHPAPLALRLRETLARLRAAEQMEQP